VIIRNKIRNWVISVKTFTFLKAIGISRSEGEPDGGEGGPSTEEGLARTDLEAGIFG